VGLNKFYVIISPLCL